MSRNRLKAFPVHLMYNTSTESDPKRKKNVQVAFSAPKRIHRSAVKRNLFKRRMREAFRPFIPGLEDFMEKNQCSLDLMLIYVGSEQVGHIDLKVKIKVLLDRLEKQLNRGITDE